MLPAEHRLTESALFAATVRGGRRVGGRTLVLHLMSRESGQPALVGFVVSKAVGNAVVRNKVKRRLRSILAARLGALPVGSLLVVRALAPAAGVDFAALDSEVGRSLDRLLDRTAA
ncbi:MAG: ribonuclease P protein component [Marmoricola sp.]